MLNVISFLVVIAGSLLYIMSGSLHGTLLDLGILMVTAHLLSLLSVYFRLPLIAGFVFAGVIVGYQGLGLAGTSFHDSLALVEGVFFMILISNSMYYMFRGESPRLCGKYLLTGAFSSFVTFLLTLGFVAPFSYSLQAKIIMGLFTATYSPVIMYASADKKISSKPFIQMAFGGYLFAILLWGLLTTYFGVSNTEKLQLAFMPLVIAISSSAAGFIWGFAAEKLVTGVSKTISNLYLFAIMFLSYPLVVEFGFDFLFFAAGIGIYYGVFSELGENLFKPSRFSLLIVFCLFGMQLSLENAVMLGNAGWSLTAILVVFFILARVISIKLSLRFIFAASKQYPPMIFFIPSGPLTLIALRRFMPGLAANISGEVDLMMIYSVLTTSILLLMIFFIVLYPLFMRSKKIPASLNNEDV